VGGRNLRVFRSSADREAQLLQSILAPALRSRNVERRKEALAGKPFTFSLAGALKNGPVVLYFYPAAFTPGCTVEAHNFAEATEKFKALGATVIGVSHDKIETLNKFSVSECRNKFAVAADADQKITKEYDAVLAQKPEYANRTSYVIAPNGKIIYEYTALDPDKHVENTMAAVEKWKAEHKS